MPLDPGFAADCPYGPGAQLLDEIVSIDRETSTIVARMLPTDDQPITRDQRVHPERHPRHVSGGLMIHVSGILGFAHAYFLLGLRHADGWIGYGTHIHDARYPRLARIGPPLRLECRGIQQKRIRGSLYVRYAFRFEQEGKVVYESEQGAVWHRVAVTGR